MISSKRPAPAVYLKETENLALDATASKKGGSEPGAWVVLSSNEESFSYLAKLDQFQNIIREKIFLDFYRRYAKAPITQIGLLDYSMAKQITGRFFDSSENADLYMAGMKVTETKMPQLESSMFSFFSQSLSVLPGTTTSKYPFILSKKIDGYSDLGEDIVAHIETYGAPPETLEYKGKPIPLYGLLEIAAVAKCLDDCDFLGGSGGNTGFIVKQTNEGDFYALAVIVDGKALTPLELNDTRPFDICIGAQSEIYIQYEKLSETQKKIFLKTIYAITRLSDKALTSLLRRRGAFEQKLPYLTGNHFFDPLIEQVKTSIKKQAQIYAAEIKRFNHAPIHMLARENAIDDMMELLATGEDPNQTTFSGKTPLYLAVENNNLEMVNLLLKKGANPSLASANSETPMHSATNHQHLAIVQLLDEADPLLKNALDSFGNTALHIAARANHTPIFAYLVNSANADVNIPNSRGETILHIALEVQNSTMIENILAQAPLLNVQNHEGNTALHIATKEWQPQVIRTLIEKGAQLNTPNHLNETPLSLAARRVVFINEDWNTLAMMLTYADKIDDSVKHYLTPYRSQLLKGLMAYTKTINDPALVKDILNRINSHNLLELLEPSSLIPFHFFKKPTPEAVTFNDVVLELQKRI